MSDDNLNQGFTKIKRLKEDILHNEVPCIADVVDLLKTMSEHRHLAYKSMAGSSTKAELDWCNFINNYYLQGKQKAFYQTLVYKKTLFVSIECWLDTYAMIDDDKKLNYKWNYQGVVINNEYHPSLGERKGIVPDVIVPKLPKAIYIVPYSTYPVPSRHVTLSSK